MSGSVVDGPVPSSPASDAVGGDPKLAPRPVLRTQLRLSIPDSDRARVSPPEGCWTPELGFSPAEGGRGGYSLRVDPYSPAIRSTLALVCDDVRFEIGNRLSLMGMFHAIVVQELPASLMKFAVINRLEGQGTATAEVRVLSPDRSEVVAASSPSPIDLSGGGFTYNMVYFVNVVLTQQGTYWVQTLLDSEAVSEVPFSVGIFQPAQ